MERGAKGGWSARAKEGRRNKLDKGLCSLFERSREVRPRRSPRVAVDDLRENEIHNAEERGEGVGSQNDENEAEKAFEKWDSALRRLFRREGLLRLPH